MASESLNIYIIGVGGFGTGSLSNVLATAAQLSGLEAVGSETHGLAQRGGVVVSTLRLGKGLRGSPLIIKGTADVLVALEPLEALRSLPFLRRGGTVAYNTQIIQPLGVRLGGEEYPDPDDIEAELHKVAGKVIPVEASQKAKGLGLAQAANMVVLGALMGSGVLPFDQETIIKAVKAVTPARFLEVNLKALEMD